MIQFRKHSKVQMSQASNKASSLHLLDENSATLYFQMFFFKKKTLNHIFIKKIDQLVTNGLVAKLVTAQDTQVHAEKHDEASNPRPLTMDHLGICFFAILICFGVSCAVFTVECFVRSRR
jgi:nitrous oxide reductase